MERKQDLDIGMVSENNIERTLLVVLAWASLLVWLAVADQAAQEPPKAMPPCGHAAGRCLSSLYPLPDAAYLLTHQPVDPQRASVAGSTTHQLR